MATTTSTTPLEKARQRHQELQNELALLEEEFQARRAGGRGPHPELTHAQLVHELEAARGYVREAHGDVQTEFLRERRRWEEEEFRPRLEKLQDRAGPHLKALRKIAEESKEQLLPELRGRGYSDADPLLGELRVLWRWAD
jgi:hypothetical protein